MTSPHRDLPECSLINLLADKCSVRKDITFDFIGTLNALRERVSAEVRYINLLFPEYTPHDEQYHLRRLFHVADTLLGVNQLAAMNSAELFILACSLYAHDWGMAVSEVEKSAILNTDIAHGYELFTLLPDEKSRFRKFTGLTRANVGPGHESGIDINVWRDYVRDTHALRSGVRIQNYFSHIDRGIGEAVSRACIGHSLELEELTDYRSYPVDFSVLRETVNLRALTVYLRLVDLFDIAEDRTPYAIWKFVQPRGSRSQMEWKKHRALQPITCPPYLDGRIVRVDGSTGDFNVYAALEDLRAYCVGQFAGCRDVLARMNDERHRLDIYNVDWRVAAVGFKPISIKFDFDRDRMFEVLSGEIYHGDAYVFLRELLQNSIDAIRTRRELLRRRGLDPGPIGVVRVVVEKDDNGDAVITWEDDGIGMDEYIVRNYLAVAGKSYYRSEDFEREGLRFEPLSRFGVGILSCFMVSDRLTIETFKDPYLPPAGEPLSIEIPSALSHFRVEPRPIETSPVGTRVTVWVRKDRLDQCDESARSGLMVTEYLKLIAGFVEFPILVTEGDRRTVIIHPKSKPGEAVSRFGREYHVAQLQYDLPWDEIFLPQDLATAKETLLERKFDLSEDLGLREFEGVLCYPYPKNSLVDITNDSGRWPADDVVVTKRDDKRWKGRLRWKHEWERWAWETMGQEGEVGKSRSGLRSPSFGVYRDGILMSRAQPPDSWLEKMPSLTSGGFAHDHLSVPLLLVNIPQSSAPRIDLARNEIIGDNKHWGQPILESWWRKLIELAHGDVQSMQPIELLDHLGRMAVFDRVPDKELWKVVSAPDWPVPVLLPGGEVSVCTLSEFGGDPLPICPAELQSQAAHAVVSRLIEGRRHRTRLSNWEGERCVILGGWLEEVTESISQMFRVGAKRVAHLHYASCVRFLTPPSPIGAPMLQQVWAPVASPATRQDLERVLEEARADVRGLTVLECQSVWQTRPSRTTILTEFAEPFGQHFAFGGEALNFNHPLSKLLVSAAAALKLSHHGGPDQNPLLGQLNDAFESVTSPMDFRSSKSWSEYAEAWATFLRLAGEAGLKSSNNVRDWKISPDDFVPGSIRITRGRITSPPHKVGKRHFGKPLNGLLMT
jgi:hypothetical protein